jgi:hypothetical protein
MPKMFCVIVALVLGACCLALDVDRSWPANQPTQVAGCGLGRGVLRVIGGANRRERRAARQAARGMRG